MPNITALENEARRAIEAVGGGYHLGGERARGVPLSRLMARDCLCRMAEATTDGSWLAVVALARLVVAHYDADLTSEEERQVGAAYDAARKPDGGAEGPVAAWMAERIARVARWPWSERASREG